jgi:hypothetical protein
MNVPIVIVQSKKASSTNAVVPTLARGLTTDSEGKLVAFGELCFAMRVLSLDQSGIYLVDEQDLTRKSECPSYVARSHR